MFVGTGSDVGKSVINAAFCRIFLQDGYRPAPFKAQNMSLNSFPTPDGLEIGRAQAVQAEACGIDARVEMNPVLLKPTSDQKAQIVLNGKPYANQTAAEYFNSNDKTWLFNQVMDSFQRLEAEHSPVVIEGAGSISEMNLWDRDIVNMRVAKAADAATILIADIDRGGVFASVYGSIQLLPADERPLIKGVLINKFRGDIALFEDGRRMLEDLTGVPVVGVVPYFRDIYIEQEDSVVMDSKINTFQDGKVNIAVTLLRHMSNFTDFDMLERLDEVNLYYTVTPEEVLKADIIIIPGSKNTISDMLHLRNTGLAKAILQAHDAGKSVYGVCGGYQIMGTAIHDPEHVEGDIESIPGLGLLPTVTTLTAEKTTEQCSFTFLDSDSECHGYEIHMGETRAEGDSPLCSLENKGTDGYFVDNQTWGTYIHGIFDNRVVIESILSQVDADLNSTVDYHSFKEEQYDKLARHIRENVDMEVIYGFLR